jgi:hypothetical protein
MTNTDKNRNDQDTARMRMDQAQERRVDALAANDEAAWDWATMVWEVACKDWQQTVREGAEACNQ